MSSLTNIFNAEHWKDDSEIWFNLIYEFEPCGDLIINFYWEIIGQFCSLLEGKESESRRKEV